MALGGWDRDDPLGQKDYAAVNLMAADLDGDRVLSLIVHRTEFAGGQPIGADILVLQPNPAASQGALPDVASTSFTPDGVYPVDVVIGSNAVTDANADGRPDVILSMGGGSDQSQINVLINGGDGRLSQPITYAGYTPGYLWAPLTVGGPTNLPGAPIAPPSFLNFSPSAGAPLGHPLVLANQSFFSNSYWVEVNSPGSYGGHHFGFIQPSGSGVTTFSGAAFVDANGNGRQDPGELNLVNTPLAITLTDPRGRETTQRVNTDAAGRWSLTDVGNWVQAVVVPSGLSPAEHRPRRHLARELHPRLRPRAPRRLRLRHPVLGRRHRLHPGARLPR